MSVTPNFCCDETKNRGAYIRLTVGIYLYIYTHTHASLVALPAMWETWVQPLGWEDPLEKGKATHSSILAWRIPLTV